jgi:hypothetical protein
VFIERMSFAIMLKCNAGLGSPYEVATSSITLKFTYYHTCNRPWLCYQRQSLAVFDTG